MDIEGRRPDASEDMSTDWEKKLILGIKTGTHEEVERTIGSIVSHMKSSVMPIGQCYIRIQKIIVSLLHALDELGSGGARFFGESANPLTDIYAFKTLDDIESWLKNTCRRAIAQVAEARSDFCEKQMRKAESYMREHYDDENLSLKTICQEVHMSASYFSTMFKQHTGKTFVEYLTGRRMEKAKELLKFTDLKNYEIASKIGYADPNYFSVLFKKLTGDSPTEYRQKTASERPL
jgi:two-component system response regulator YesN